MYQPWEHLYLKAFEKAKANQIRNIIEIGPVYHSLPALAIKASNSCFSYLAIEKNITHSIKLEKLLSNIGLSYNICNKSFLEFDFNTQSNSMIIFNHSLEDIVADLIMEERLLSGKDWFINFSTIIDLIANNGKTIYQEVCDLVFYHLENIHAESRHKLCINHFEICADQEAAIFKFNLDVINRFKDFAKEKEGTYYRNQPADIFWLSKF